MPTPERKIASPPNVPEDFQLEEIDSLDLNNRDAPSIAFVCVTNEGTLWFEPELQTMGGIKHGDGCLYSQRRMHIRSRGGESRASREDKLFVCGLGGYIPLEVSSMRAIDRIRWEVLIRIANLPGSSLTLECIRRAKDKADQIACKHSKTQQGDEAMILKPGLSLFMETGLDGQPWVANKADAALTGEILALYKIKNFNPESVLSQYSQLLSLN